MIFTIRDRKITSTEKKILIADNADYIAEFDLDSEWQNKIVTARFINRYEYADVILEEGKCIIPLNILSSGSVAVGVYSGEMTTNRIYVKIVDSIKSQNGTVAPPVDNIYEQLMQSIENLEEGMTEQIEQYMAEHYDGVDGQPGKDGVDGQPGKDGVDGQPGADGYTPVRGTDYWTAADIAAIKAYVDEVILGGAW